MIGQEAVTQGKSNGNHLDIESSISQARALAFESVSHRLLQIAQAIDFSLVPSLVDNGFAMALQVSLQRCCIQITYLNIGKLCRVCNNLGLANIPDSEDTELGRVAFIVNPGFTKWATHMEEI